MQRKDISIESFSSYALLDSGEGRKLEQFGPVVLDRPDPQALWLKGDRNSWVNADAQFLWVDKGERWKLSKDTPKEWTFQHNNITLQLSCGGFKHIGIFPEHSHQWDELLSLGSEKEYKMLNLFGYTGAASIAGALSGMKVTHVDASKSTLETVRKNMSLSGLPENAIRVICEDALKYTKRLIDRGEQFEVVVMDPPAFGRGPKGEVWKIEESITSLVELIPKLLSPEAKLVILNGYASGYSAITFGQLLNEVLKRGSISYGEIGLKEKDSDRVLTTGIYAKWQQ